MQSVGVRRAVLGKSQPLQEVQIAQASARALHVRFEQINGRAVFVAFLGPGVENRAEQRLAVSFDHLGEAGAKIVVQLLIA